jgi:hypothetical protein
MHDVDLSGEVQTSSERTQPRKQAQNEPLNRKPHMQESRTRKGEWIRHGRRLVIKGVFNTENEA